jgi:hypothetical protein
MYKKDNEGEKIKLRPWVGERRFLFGTSFKQHPENPKSPRQYARADLLREKTVRNLENNSEPLYPPQNSYQVTERADILVTLVTHMLEVSCSNLGCDTFHPEYFNDFYQPLLKNGSRDSSVGIAAGYGLDERGVGVRVPVIR